MSKINVNVITAVTEYTKQSSKQIIDSRETIHQNQEI